MFVPKLVSGPRPGTIIKVCEVVQQATTPWIHSEVFVHRAMFAGTNKESNALSYADVIVHAGMAIEIEESRRQVISFNDNLFEIWDDITTFDVVSWMRAVRARMEPQSIHWHFSGGSPCPDNGEKPKWNTTRLVAGETLLPRCANAPNSLAGK